MKPPKPPMDAERLKQIQERVEKATPGPWECRHGLDGGGWDLYAQIGEDSLSEAILATRAPWEHRAAISHATGELIAHAPTDLADLLSEVERLRTRVRWLEALSECPDCGQRPGGAG